MGQVEVQRGDRNRAAEPGRHVGAIFARLVALEDADPEVGPAGSRPATTSGAVDPVESIVIASPLRHREKSDRMLARDRVRG